MVMPRLWEDTVDAHRQAVRGAVLDATSRLVAGHGVGGVSMSAVADAAGVGRATLYRYFPDLDAVLTAWHQRQVAGHLHQLRDVAARAADASGHGGGSGVEARLRAVLTAYAFSSAQGAGTDVAAVLHHGERMDAARSELVGFMRDLLAEGSEAGVVRTDVPSGELTNFVLHALGAAAEVVPAHGSSGAGESSAGSRRRSGHAAVDRLIGLVLDGLRPPG
jgi:AcrR family transcriptional regulator